MTYIRGDKAQFDAWEDLGNPGWNWDAMLPYYKKSELYTVPTDVQIAAGATYKPLKIDDDGRAETGVTVPGATPDSGAFFVTVAASAANPETVVACGNLAPPAR